MANNKLIFSTLFLLSMMGAPSCFGLELTCKKIDEISGYIDGRSTAFCEDYRAGCVLDSIIDELTQKNQGLSGNLNYLKEAKNRNAQELAKHQQRCFIALHHYNPSLKIDNSPFNSGAAARSASLDHTNPGHPVTANEEAEAVSADTNIAVEPLKG